MLPGPRGPPVVDAFSARSEGSWAGPALLRPHPSALALGRLGPRDAGCSEPKGRSRPVPAHVPRRGPSFEAPLGFCGGPASPGSPPQASPRPVARRRRLVVEPRPKSQSLPGPGGRAEGGRGGPGDEAGRSGGAGMKGAGACGGVDARREGLRGRRRRRDGLGDPGSGRRGSGGRGGPGLRRRAGGDAGGARAEVLGQLGLATGQPGSAPGPVP